MGGSTLRTFALPLLLAFFTRQVHPSLVTPAALLGFTLTLVTSDPLSWVVDRGTLVSSSVGVSTQDPAWAEGRGVCEVLVQRKCTSLGPRYHVETCGSPTSTPGTTGDGYNRSMRFYACSGAPPPQAPTPWGPATGQWGGGTATPQWMHQPQDTATTSSFSASGAWGAGPLGSEGYYGQEGEGLLGGGVELDEEAARLMARGSVLAGLAQRGGALGVARRAAAGSSSGGGGGGGSAAGAAARGRRRGVWDETPEHRLPIASLPGGPPGAQWGGQPYNPSAPAPAQYPLPSACSAASGVGGGTGGISSGGGGGGGGYTPPTLGSIVCLETTPRIPPVGRGPVSVNLGVASSSAAAGSRCTCFLRHPGDSEIDWSGGQGVNGLGREEEELQRQQQQQQQNELQFPLHHPGRATSASAATASAMP